MNQIITTVLVALPSGLIVLQTAIKLFGYFFEKNKEKKAELLKESEALISQLKQLTNLPTKQAEQTALKITKMLEKLKR